MTPAQHRLALYRTLAARLRELADRYARLVEELEEDLSGGMDKEDRMGLKRVLIRTYSAGVHFGELVRRDGKEVELTNARKIWSWQGANTLHEIALHGVSKGSRVSEPVPSIVLTEAIEIIEMSAEAWSIMEGIGWSR